MYTINPGDFKHKIELQEVKISTNADNIPTKTLITIWTTKSRVRNNISIACSILNIREENKYLQISIGAIE